MREALGSSLFIDEGTEPTGTVSDLSRVPQLVIMGELRLRASIPTSITSTANSHAQAAGSGRVFTGLLPWTLTFCQSIIK